MARPRKDPSDLRTVPVRFRATTGEYMRMQHAAAAAGLPLSEYARRRMLTNRPVGHHHSHPPAAHSPAVDPALLTEIKRIGVNINQAVKRFHSRDRMPPELPRLAATLDRLLHKLLAKIGSDGPQGRR